MRLWIDRLAANVAEVLGALLAFERIEGAFLLVNFAAEWAEAALLNVNTRVFGKTQELLDHLRCNLFGKQRIVFI